MLEYRPRGCMRFHYNPRCQIPNSKAGMACTSSQFTVSKSKFKKSKASADACASITSRDSKLGDMRDAYVSNYNSRCQIPKQKVMSDETSRTQDSERCMN